MDVPPKMLKQHVDRQRELVRSTASLVMNQLGLSADKAGADSLPVLNAFRDYLEAERRKARRRAVVFATVTALILLLILGGGLALNLSFLQMMKKDFQDIQGQASLFQEVSDTLRKDTRALLSGFESKAAKAQKDVEDGVQSVLRARAELESQGQAQDTRLQQLQKAIEAMEKSSREIQDQIGELKARSVRAEAAPRATPVAEAKHVVAAAESPAAAEAPGPGPGASTILLSIAPRGQEQSVAWRLPVPE